MTKDNDNILFLEAIEKKNYILVNELLKQGVPDLTYDKSNEFQKSQYSTYFNKLKFNLRELYLDGEFYAAQKIISKFDIKRKQTQGESTITREDLAVIADYLIQKKSNNIHFFWNQFFKSEHDNKLLIRFTLSGIEAKNTNFLSSYDNIKVIFNSSLLLKNAVNISFSKTFNNDFFQNLYKFYFVYNPEFNFKDNLVKTLKHQLLIRNTESIKTEQFQHIETIYSTYFPNLYSFKIAHGLYQSLKKKPENDFIFNEYIQEIFKLHDMDVIKEHGAFLFKNNPELNQKFKLFNKLSENLSTSQISKIKINKI